MYVHCTYIVQHIYDFNINHYVYCITYNVLNFHIITNTNLI